MNSDEARQWEGEASLLLTDLDEMSLAPLHCSDDTATLSASELAATDLMSRACMWLRSMSNPSPSIPYLAWRVSVSPTNTTKRSDNAWAATCWAWTDCHALMNN